MLKIRLQRRGKKNYATYRVVVADRRAPVKGKFIADLGPYNPHTNEFRIDKETTLKWLDQGAQCSPTVHNLLIENKIIKGKKVTSWRPKKKSKKKEAT
jgi:small subunit ribosomal protein S16